MMEAARSSLNFGSIIPDYTASRLRTDENTIWGFAWMTEEDHDKSDTGLDSKRIPPEYNSRALHYDQGCKNYGSRARYVPCVLIILLTVLS